MTPLLRSNFSRLILTAAIGACAAFSFLLRFTDFLILSRSAKVLTFAGTWGIFTFLLLLILTEPVQQLIRIGKTKSSLLMLALSLLAAAVVLGLAYRLPPFPQTVSLRISPAPAAEPAAPGGALTLLSVKRVDLPSGRVTPLSSDDLNLQGGWIVSRDSTLLTLPAGEQGTASYNNFIQGYVIAEFQTGPGMGKAVLQLNATTRVIELNAPAPGSVEEQLHPQDTWANADAPRRILLAGNLLAEFVLLTSAFCLAGLVIFHLVFTRRMRAQGLWPVVLVVLLAPLLLFIVNGLQREVRFADPALESAVRVVIQQPQGSLRSHDLLSVIELDVQDQQLTSLEGIGALRNLRVLKAGGNRVADLEPLGKLVKLQELDLSRNGLTDLSALPVLPELQRLDLSGNQLSDITTVGQLHDLTDLDLSRNLIIDISQLANLPLLERLNLRENDIRDITALTGLYRLTYLNLHSNRRIKDISPITTLTRLQTLILRNIPLGEQISLLTGLHSLMYLNIRNCSLQSVDALVSLMEMGALQGQNSAGMASSINILENDLGRMTDDSPQRLRAYWGRVVNRYPYQLPYQAEGVSPPEFSQPGGFYTESVNLALTTTEDGASIFYTTDGSVPEIDTHSNPLGSTLVYTRPLQLENRSREGGYLSAIETSRFWQYAPGGVVFTGNVIRAVAVDDIGRRSEIVTHSYFIDAEMGKRYSFPVVSLTTDPGGFFDDKAGIYVPGDLYESLYANLTLNPANYSQHGLEWERDGNMEMFNSTGEVMFSLPVGIRVHGDATRAYSQKSLRIYARGQRPDASAVFDYDFFPRLSGRLGIVNAHEFDALLLRNSGQDWNGTLFKDALTHSLLENTRLDIQGVQPVIVFLNGEYWGIHNVRNYYDEGYFRNYYGIQGGVTLVYDGAVPEMRFGDPDGEELYQRLLRVIDPAYGESDYHTIASLAEQRRYEQVTAMMDVDNFIDYYVTQIFIKNNDLQVYRWRKNVDAPLSVENTPYGHDGKWRWLMYDTDLGFTDPAYNTLRYLTMEDSASTYLLRSLLENAEFRNKFINRFADLLNTNFREEVVVARIDEFENLYAPAIREQIARWGKPAPDYRSWRDNVEELRVFARERPVYQRNQLVEYFDLAGLANLAISAEEEAGYVQVNSIEIKTGTPGVIDAANWRGVYFQDVPLTLSAQAKPGYRFSHWEGLPQGRVTDSTLEITLTDDLTLKAVFTREP